MRNRVTLIAVLIILSVVFSACNLPRATLEPMPTGSETVKTFAAQTVVAMSTQLAAVTPTLSPTIETQASTVTVPVQATPTLQVTLAPEESPTAPAQPSITPTPMACDRVRFIKDITIPDGTVLVPGQTFTKTWELENVGSCTWSSSYSLVFANEGSAMDGAASKQLTTTSIAPGQRAQISVDLKAPATPGSYRGYWKLRNASGVLFGIGEENEAFYVDIRVGGTTYSFVDNYCTAEWRSGAGVLPCPGSTGDSRGWVVKVDSPHLENGSNEDEPALWANPQLVDNGEIRATFPAINVSAGTHFRTIIGCLYGATNCNVKFLLNYRADGGSEQTFAEWTENYNGEFNKINLDLASLAGKSVQFILVVRANGASDNDQAFWLMPRLGP